MARSDQPDPYRTLGVSKSDDADTIKKAYRKLARELHPDRGGDPEKLKGVNGAYDIVGDETKRKLFDEFGHDAFRPGFDAAQARAYRNFGGGRGGRGGAGGFQGSGGNIDLEELMKMFGGGGGGFSFNSGGAGPGGGGRQRGPRRGDDMSARIAVSLTEALSGSKRQFRSAGGQTVTVNIPKGVRSGQKLRVAGKGGSGTDGGPPGDVIIEVEVQPHPLVRVDRDDLEMDLPITFGESIRGGSITVSTPTGSVNVKLPAGAEAGMRLRLKGRGLPRGGKGTRLGDLYLVLRPTPPTEPVEDLDEALDALDAATPAVRAALKFGD